MAGPLIVTAELGAKDFAWLDGERRRHFPPERNRLPAHLTIFHALPPSVEAEAAHLLAELTRNRPPEARVTGLVNLGGGVAYRVASQELDSIRETIADHFHGMLTAQDAGGWRPHVTIQNKVDNRGAVDLLKTLEAEFRPRPLTIRGLGLHRYMGGPWEMLGIYPFRAVR